MIPCRVSDIAPPTVRRGRGGAVACLLALVLASLPAPGALASEVLVLGRAVPVRQAPHSSGRELRTLLAGETCELAGRRSGRGQPHYTLDSQGILWLRIRLSEDLRGYVAAEQVSVAREETRSPRGTPLLLVNLRATADGSVERDLWLVPEEWSQARPLGGVLGRPLWSATGDWFLGEMNSGKPIRDPLMERNMERLERISADGQTRIVLAAGSQPVVDEARGEVYFYRDVDERGEPTPPGLFAIQLDGRNLRPLYFLPERYRFWREEGDYFVQAPPPILKGGGRRLALFAYERGKVLVRFTLTLDGTLLDVRRE